MESTNNFRKWMAFNSSLEERGYAENLYSAVDRVTSQGSIHCHRIDEQAVVQYQILDSTMSSGLVLDDNERAEFLLYLKTHYLSGSVEPKIDQTTADYHNTTVPLPATDSRFKTWFVNKNIRKHVLGYGIIGIIGLQFFIIPTNVFDVKYPDFTKTLWIIFFGLLTHFAVNIYKKNFLIGGILYRTVWRVTFWLYSLIFLVGGLEIALIDLLEGKGMLSFILVPIILLAGYCSGWILSVPIYFLNGGKLVTDPEAVRYRD